MTITTWTWTAQGRELYLILKKGLTLYGSIKAGFSSDTEKEEKIIVHCNDKDKEFKLSQEFPFSRENLAGEWKMAMVFQSRAMEKNIEDTGRMICLMEEVSFVRMQADMKEIL